MRTAQSSGVALSRSRGSSVAPAQLVEQRHAIGRRIVGVEAPALEQQPEHVRLPEQIGLAPGCSPRHPDAGIEQPRRERAFAPGCRPP